MNLPMHPAGNISMPLELRAAALHCLSLTDAPEKAESVRYLQRLWQEGRLTVHAQSVLKEQTVLPGRPLLPQLVRPAEVPRRSMHTSDGKAALVHALAHIEFNAINLALDAVWRFPGLPQEYYADWLKVAAEEAYHFILLSRHLQQQDYRYGDFHAHNGLWEMAEKTKESALARMALVPRTLEARGLDASPALRAKLSQAGDEAGASILDIILRDEIGHVAIGNRWYAFLCDQAGLEPITTYRDLANRYGAPALRGPFNFEARRQAGFSEAELVALGK
jgi:uncharacterized ferritin-like protein (DUF455 family)